MTSGDLEPQSEQSADLESQPEQAGEAAAYPPPPAGEEPGGLGLRFAARFIDGIIILVAAVALGWVLNALINYVDTGWISNWISLTISGLLTFIYFVAFETSQGWTPGKKVLGLTVHGPGGAPKPTVQQSAIRNVWTLFPIIPLSIGPVLLLIAIVWIAVTINGSPTKQGKHDELAGGTQVVKG